MIKILRTISKWSYTNNLDGKIEKNYKKKNLIKRDGFEIQAIKK